MSTCRACAPSPDRPLRRPDRARRRLAAGSARPGRRHHRAQRGRQDHALQRGLRVRARRSRARITLDGRPFRPRPHHLHRHGIARTLQGVGQFDGLTVLENVLVGSAGKPDRGGVRGPGALRRRRVRPASYPAACPMRTANGSSWPAPWSPSRGFCMLDEPAGGLDADEIGWLAGLIRELDTTVLLVEHHMDLVMAVCDEILVLDFGKPIALGAPGEIRDEPEGRRGLPGGRRMTAARGRGPHRRLRGGARAARGRPHRAAPGRSSPCSGPTAPARRPCCVRSPAWCPATAGRRRRSTASTCAG